MHAKRSLLKSERQVRGHQRRRKDGRPFWGSRPFGFERDGQHREREAEALRQAYSDVLAGRSLYAITRRLNEEGMLSPRDRPWRSSNLRHVLMHPRNAGIVTQEARVNGKRVREELSYDASWEPIVSVETFRAVARFLSQPGRRPEGTGGRRKGLLTGIVFCSECGGMMSQAWSRANKAGEKYRIFSCREGRCITNRADETERYIIDSVVAHVDEWVGLLDDSTPPDERQIEDLRAEQTPISSRLEELTEMHVLGQISMAQLVSGTEKANGRLAEVDELLDEYAVSSVKIDMYDARAFQAKLHELAYEDQEKLRAIICRATERIELLPRGKGARHFRLGDVRIEWRKSEQPPRFRTLMGGGSGTVHGYRPNREDAATEAAVEG